MFDKKTQKIKINKISYLRNIFKQIYVMIHKKVIYIKHMKIYFFSK